MLGKFEKGQNFRLHDTIELRIKIHVVFWHKYGLIALNLQKRSAMAMLPFLSVFGQINAKNVFSGEK